SILKDLNFLLRLSFSSVEIGEHCNGIDLLCRAKNARCRTHVHSSDEAMYPPFVCSCEANYIPVFQHYLGYKECFRRLPLNHTSCADCSKTGGQCYSMNERSSDANGCLCPNNRAPTITTASLEEQERALSSPHLGAQVESCAESL
ncbi:hypothetical protein AHF37_11576, partial [Paragonimus kellicotti]